MAAKRKIDWTQVAALAVVLAAVVVCILYADPEKAQAWLAVGPGILGFLAALWSASRGRALPPPGES